MSCPLDAIDFWRSPMFFGATCACGWVAQYHLRSEVDTAVMRHIEGRLPEGLEALLNDGLGGTDE